MTNLNLEKDTFTEEEAINITIQHGYNGSEFKTEVWKKRGCLNVTRTLESLIKKLKTIYHIVEVEGKGKKRRFILRDKKKEVTEREYNYKGTVPTSEDEIMKEYLLNHLLQMGTGHPKTYNKWIEEFKLLQPNNVTPTETLIEKMKELHWGRFYNSREIVSEFLNAIRNYNFSIVSKSFARLEKEGRIDKTSFYVFVSPQGDHKVVSSEEYQEVYLFKKEFIESLGVKYKHYILSYRSFHKTKEMENIISMVNEETIDKFNVHYMYEMISINILNRDVKKPLSKNEFNQAYFQKFIKLSKDRQNRKDYKDSQSFWRRSYLLNTSVLLTVISNGIIEIKGLEEIMNKEIESYNQQKNFAFISN